MNFLIFLHNFTNRRFSLTIDLSNFPICFFLLSLLLTSLELLPFHLKELYFTLGLLGGSGGKESACNIGHPGLTPGSDRLPGEGKGNQLQYSCLENSLDRGSWRLRYMGSQSQTVYDCSWAYPNCQHHYSCYLGPITSKTRSSFFTWSNLTHFSKSLSSLGKLVAFPHLHEREGSKYNVWPATYQQ